MTRFKLRLTVRFEHLLEELRASSIYQPACRLSPFGVWRKVTLGKLLELNPGVPVMELMMAAHDPAAWEVRYGGSTNSPHWKQTLTLALESPILPA